MIMVVSGIKSSAEGGIYTLLGGGKAVVASLPINLKLLEGADVENDGDSYSHNSKVPINTVDDAAVRSELGKVLAKMKLDRPKDGRAKLGPGRDDIYRIDSAMEGKLSEAAVKFASALFSGAPISVRFHNDGDGSSGAIALHRAVEQLGKKSGCEFSNVYWRMQRSIAYSEDDLGYDRTVISRHESLLRPLIVMVDFGTTGDSNSAMEHAGSIADFIWLDHHPVVPEFKKELAGIYINPWDFGGDSNYTAGMLAARFAEILSGTDMRLMKEVSMISDVSKYADKSYQDAQKIATVLDFITGSRKYSRNGSMAPSEMRRLINDGERLSSLFSEISEIVSDSITSGAKYSKSYRSKGGIRVRVLDFDKVLAENPETLLPGRYSSRLHESLFDSGGSGGITIVSFGSYISIRVSKNLSEKIALPSIIAELSEEFDGEVSGGGHNEASSIKVPDHGMMDEVMRSLLRKLGV